MATTPTTPTSDTAYPKVFFSVLERIAPRIIHNAEEEAALNQDEWTTIPPTAKAAEEPKFPAILSNINVPAQVVHNPAEEALLGSAWKRLDLAVEGLELTAIPAEPTEPPPE